MQLKYRLFLATGLSVLTVILAAMSVNTYYFYNLAREARKKEIKSSFQFFLGQINEKVAGSRQTGFDIARTGEIFYTLKQPLYNVNANLMESYLLERVRKNPDVYGAGLWYEPNLFGKKYMGPYAYWEKDQTRITWEYNTKAYDYLNRNWYSIAIPKTWKRTNRRNKDFYRTEPYEDMQGDRNIIWVTLSTLMYDKQGWIIGVSTVDWTLESTQKLLKDFRITPGSFAVLIEKKSGRVLYHPDPKMLMKDQRELSWINVLGGKTGNVSEIVERQRVQIHGRTYELYQSLTEGDFILVSFVDVEEAYAFMSGLIIRNVTLSLLTLIALGFLLFAALGKTLTPLHEMIKILRDVASGNRNLEHRMSTERKDEFGELAGTYNQMAATIIRQNNEIRIQNEQLEKRVVRRTMALKNTLNRIRTLKKQQDGDYFLTTLLAAPLFKNHNRSRLVATEFHIEQYKKFKFRRWNSHLGGDLCVTGNLNFGGSHTYSVF